MVVIINNKSLTDIKAEYVAEVSPKNVVSLPTDLKEPDWETIAFQRKLLRDEIRELYALLRKIILEPHYNLTKEVKEETMPTLVENIVGAYTNFVNTLHKYEAVEYLLSQIVQTVIGEKYSAYPLKKGMLYLSKPGMKKPKKYPFYNISYTYQQGDDLSTILVGDLYLSARIKGLESMLLKILRGYRSFNDMLGIKFVFNGWDDEAVQLIGYEINGRLLELGFKSLPRSSVKIKRRNKEGEVFPVIYQSEREKVLVLYANDYEMVRPGHNRREIKRKKLKGKSSHDMILYSIKNEPHKPQEYWLDLGNNKGMLITLLEYENKDVLLENIMCLVSRYLQEKEHLNKESSFEISYKDIELIPWGYWYANKFERKILDEDSLTKLLEVLLPKGTELKQENFPLNIRNYFQNPKKNGYKSFHINLALPSGEGGNILGIPVEYSLPFIEMQVLNMKAYKNNELGSASHKSYKENTLGSELRESLKKLYETLIPCNVFTDGGRGRKEAYVEVITVLLKEAIEQHSQKYQSLRLTYP